MECGGSTWSRASWSCVRRSVIVGGFFFVWLDGWMVGTLYADVDEWGGRLLFRQGHENRPGPHATFMI
jgi:hypothetical protein